MVVADFLRCFVRYVDKYPQIGISKPHVGKLSPGLLIWKAGRRKESAMEYRSILGVDADSGEPREMAAALHDGRIDSLIDAACQDVRWAEARPLFLAPPAGERTARWRLGVFSDLMADPALRSSVEAFSRDLSALLDDLAAVLERFGPKEAARLDDVCRLELLSCADHWCSITEKFQSALKAAHLGEGLGSFERYLERYLASDAYMRLKDDIAHAEKLLGYVQYSLLVDEVGMRVRKYQGEPALSRGLEELVRPFESYSKKPEPAWRDAGTADPAMEASVLDVASRDFGDQFRALQTFCERHTAFADEKIARFAWDVRFYLAWLTLADALEEKGLPVCLPEPAKEGDIVELEDVRDAALALADGCTGMTLAMAAGERLAAISGRPGSGRTSAARAIIQATWCAAMGLPVCAKKARLAYLGTLSTWMQDAPDAKRALAGIRGALAGAGEDALLVLDCPLPEGSPQDQLAFLELAIGEALASAAAVVVTAGPDGVTVPEGLEHACASFAFADDAEHPEARTHRLVRHAPWGMETARGMAERYGLGQKQLEERLAANREGADAQ